jgi:hypothetical protein
MVLSLVLVPASQSAPALAAASSLSLFFILLVRWPLSRGGRGYHCAVWGMWGSGCEREDRGRRKGTQRRRADAFQPRGEGGRREERPASLPLSLFKETTTSWLSVGVCVCMWARTFRQVACVCLPCPPPDERFPTLPVLLSFPSIPFPPPFLPRPTSQRTVAANAHGGQERMHRKPGVAPSHTQAGRGRGISTSPTLFLVVVMVWSSEGLVWVL